MERISVFLPFVGTDPEKAVTSIMPGPLPVCALSAGIATVRG
jgi:hypothetical protein